MGEAAPWTTEAREAFAAKLRKVNPRRLADWQGMTVRGEGHVNPYQHYVRAYFLSAPRETQIADLLIGDLVVGVLIHRDLRITDLASGETWQPHRGAA